MERCIKCGYVYKVPESNKDRGCPDCGTGRKVQLKDIAVKK
jgi:predicted  nucleic acid-binding Zn-ribbon protein